MDTLGALGIALLFFTLIILIPLQDQEGPWQMNVKEHHMMKVFAATATLGATTLAALTIKCASGLIELYMQLTMGVTPPFGG
jgi:hypothetical protein